MREVPRKLKRDKKKDFTHCVKSFFFCAAAGRGTPLRGRHGQGVVRRADHDLRYGALCCIDAYTRGVAGKAIACKRDCQLPCFRAARRGNTLCVRDMIAACSGELAVKEAFADVDLLRRFIDFKRVTKSTAVAGNTDLLVTCKTTIYGIVICKIADAVIKNGKGVEVSSTLLPDVLFSTLSVASKLVRSFGPVIVPR